MPHPDRAVHRYHDGTKHHFNHFARSLGYLDWASQPRPFRTFSGARTVALHPAPDAPSTGYRPSIRSYDGLFGERGPESFNAGLLGDVLRHALGLSAWKQYGRSRSTPGGADAQGWSLRVNPSSGNLHPTEAYVVHGPVAGLAEDAVVCHYAADGHALEIRCRFDAAAWTTVTSGRPAFLIALTSIHWREAWKYGERAFRYCQHDLGHAMACVSLAAAVVGWRAAALPAWPQRAIAALLGIDRDGDYVDAEREDPGCVIAVTPDTVPEGLDRQRDALVDAVRAGEWSGHASQLSEDHVQWSFIDEIAAATEDVGRPSVRSGSRWSPGVGTSAAATAASSDRGLDARALILQRRSAVAFDGMSRIDADRFFAILARAMPVASAPWDTIWWAPRIHFAVFVHRVDGVAPGVYVLGREDAGLARLLAALGPHADRTPAHDTLPFICLAKGEARTLARRLSCDQDIAADGFFSLGMLAEFDASLDEMGPAFYRHLFWETGIVGQVLYLEAEAAGARATGIGCFYDDPVHDALGLRGHEFQSLYHFAVGAPVEDTRLTSEPGYAWEHSA